MAETKVSLKLLIDKKNHQVLFAEAGKDFVDFLFNLLSLPLGTVVRLLTKHNMMGSLGTLYASIEDLSGTYLQLDKDCILNPKVLAAAAIEAPFLLSDNIESPTRNVYLCQCCYNYVANKENTVCPGCRNTMNRQVQFANNPAAATNQESSSDKEGFVKGVVTYMVMDNLEVKPMSTISGITLLNKFKVQEIGALEEKVVHLSVAEGLNLLKESLQSDAVLTSVFLGSRV